MPPCIFMTNVAAVCQQQTHSLFDPLGNVIYSLSFILMTVALTFNILGSYILKYLLKCAPAGTSRYSSVGISTATGDAIMLELLKCFACS